MSFRIGQKINMARKDYYGITAHEYDAVYLGKAEGVNNGNAAIVRYFPKRSDVTKETQAYGVYVIGSSESNAFNGYFIQEAVSLVYKNVYANGNIDNVFSTLETAQSNTRYYVGTNKTVLRIQAEFANGKYTNIKNVSVI